MRAASCSKELVEGVGTGEHVPEPLLELLEGGVERLAALALLEHLVEGVEGVAQPGQLLGPHRAERLGHPLGVGLGHLLAQLLDQLLEPLPGLGGDEVVALQPAHPAGHVVGEEVEGDPALGGHVVGHLLAPLVARDPRLVHQLVDGRPLLGHHLVEGLGHPGQLAVGVAALEELGPPPAEPLEELARAEDPLPALGAHPGAQQPPQGVVEVAAGQHFVGQLGQQVLGVEAESLLGAVPAR